MQSLRDRFADDGLTRFLPNMDAMLCRVALHTGDLDEAAMKAGDLNGDGRITITDVVQAAQVTVGQRTI